ncbi:THAP domain-containing protein 11-like [Stylophora pistillata]|uniref:THAP domain-containing protein 11-like n=1 Tax=Stylophora pistillata TaxID=50429 RepID=UPI000C04ADCC|nr:THAP domain-containing protein 11-like [Stylophora pistillata]
MPKYNCCVPGCTNSHRDKPSGFKFYCIPKDTELRKTYDIILRNATLKIDSPSTRICADHWENGKKLSRSRLPSLFPWSKQKEERRKIVKASQEEIEKHSKKRKVSSEPEPVVCMEVEPTETLNSKLWLKFQLRQIFCGLVEESSNVCDESTGNPEPVTKIGRPRSLTAFQE